MLIYYIIYVTKVLKVNWLNGYMTSFQIDHLKLVLVLLFQINLTKNLESRTVLFCLLYCFQYTTNVKCSYSNVQYADDLFVFVIDDDINSALNQLKEQLM